MENSKNNTYYYFIVLIFLYLSYQLATNSTWILSGEVWAEMATNYYHFSLSNNISTALFSTDYGYIPFPQRIISLFFALIKIPTHALPFLYTCSALLLIALMVGIFCSYIFREVVSSDFLRFLFCLLVLLNVDFETKTFINFTYFSAFYIGTLSALMLVTKKNLDFKLLWIIPFLCFSKPAVLAALPGFFLGAYNKNKKTLFILLLAVFLGLIQVLMLYSNYANNNTLENTTSSAIFKFLLSIKYFLFFIGRYYVGSLFNLNEIIAISLGFFILIIGVFFCFRKKDNSYSLIFIGFLLIYFNSLLNIFTIPNTWNNNLTHLLNLPVYRHNIISIFGLYLSALGFAVYFSSYLKQISRITYLVNSAAILFIFWVVASGWLSRSINFNREPVFPILNNSYWKDLSPILDNKNITSPICIPINPLGWVYSRNCMLLNPEINWMSGYHFDLNNIIYPANKILLQPPLSISKNSLVSLGIVVRPYNNNPVQLTAYAYIHLKDREKIKIFTGQRALKIDGGLVLLSGVDPVPLSSIEKIEISFSSPVQVSYFSVNGKSEIGVLWMGN